MKCPLARSLAGRHHSAINKFLENFFKLVSRNSPLAESTNSNLLPSKARRPFKALGSELAEFRQQIALIGNEKENYYFFPLGAKSWS